MKKWHRFAAFALVAALLLAGCNTKPADPTTVTNSGPASTPTATTVIPTSNTTEPTEKDYSVKVQYLPENVNNPDDLPVLKWVVLTQYRNGGRNQTRTEDAVHEVNQMLADKGMPFRVQFILLSTNTHDSYWDWHGTPELKEAAEPYLLEADLICGKMSADNLRTYFSPITEYVTGTAEPSLKNAAVHPVEWEQTTVDGEIYGIYTVAEGPTSKAWQIDPQLLTKCGLSEEDFKRDFWEMDDVFAKIYKELGNRPFLTTSMLIGILTVLEMNGNKTYYPGGLEGTMSVTSHHAGACFIVDYSSGTPRVINYLESDFFRNVWKAMMRYRDAGYVKKGELNRTDTVTYGAAVGETPHIDSNGILRIPVSTSVMKYTANPNTSGVGAASLHKEEAITLLNLIAEDEAFRMQLMFGKEGRDYNIVNGNYVPIFSEDGSSYCMDAISPYAYFSGLTTEGDEGLSATASTHWTKITHEGKTQLQTYRDVMDNIGIMECSIVFDWSALQQELAAMEEIFKEYFYHFINNTGKDRMTEERYNEMLQKLKDAGSEKVQAELQRQLDAWLAANPDWQ